MEIPDRGSKALWKPHPDWPATWEPTHWGGELTSEGPFSSLLGLCLFRNKCFSGQALVPGTFPPCFTQTEFREDKGSGFQHPGYYCGLLTKQWHFSSTQKDRRIVSWDWCIYHIWKTRTVGTTTRESGKFPNFYLHLLPLFVNMRSPDYSLILLPAFLATSFFLITFSLCNTFNCPSPLALFPPLLLFVILIVFWYNSLLIQGLERIVHVTVVCHFTMHLVSSTCKYQEKGVAPLSLLSSCTFSLLLLCQICVTTTHELTDPTKDFFW